MLEEKKNLVNWFVCFRNSVQISGITDDAKLVIHAHEKTLSVHIRKYNVPEASEVDTLVVREQDGNLDIILGCCSEFDVYGY